MAHVRVPPLMRDLTGGQTTVSAPGRTVTQVIDALDMTYPGFVERLVPGGKLAAGLRVFIDDQIVLRGLNEAVNEDSEIRFLPLVGGG